jgi:hypothetical protein
MLHARRKITNVQEGSGIHAGREGSASRARPLSFEVEVDPGLDAGGVIGARIRPVDDFVNAFEASGVRLSEGVLDIVSDLVAELARRDVDDGGTEIVE